VNVRLLVATTFLALRLAGATGPDPLLRFEFEEPHMGTTWRIVMCASDADVASRARRAAFARLAELDSRLSDYKRDSELMTVEREAVKGPLSVSPDLFHVLSSAQALATQTHGAFDVTAGALTRLWRRARRLGVLPARREIESARAVSGHHRMWLDAAARSVTLAPGVQLDVGGIAKGFGADEALARLRRYGITRAVVAGGGDIAAGDAPPASPGWMVEIAGWNDLPASSGSMVLTRSGVSTSGDTEQWVESGGVRYSHILDPRTGRALTEGRLVTVIAPNAITSDMLATAASVLAVADAVRLVEATPGAAMRLGTRASGGDPRWLTTDRWPHQAPERQTTQSAAGGQ
jgi:thiamine biosynthesis lipoprotein